MRIGTEAVGRAGRMVRRAIVQEAEVVACTLSSAGGDLLSLVTDASGPPGTIVDANTRRQLMLFDVLIIDEVGGPVSTMLGLLTCV